MPGHAGSFGVAFPELVVNCSVCTAGGLSHVLLDPFQNETWRVVGALLAEAAAIFPDARLHLGTKALSQRRLWLDRAPLTDGAMALSCNGSRSQVTAISGSLKVGSKLPDVC